MKKNIIKNIKKHKNIYIIILSIILILFISYYVIFHYLAYKRRQIKVNDRMKILTEIYTTFVDIAEKQNVKPFLLFGTLLGQQRNNKIICYDYDVDVGILSTDYYKLQAALKQKLDKNKYTLLVFDNCLIAKTMHIIDNKTFLNLDIDVYEEQPNGSFKKKINYLFHFLNTYVLKQCKKLYIPRDWLLPLKQVSFLGKKVYVPNNPKAFLECDYGKNYLTPNHKCNKSCTNCVKI